MKASNTRDKFIQMSIKVPMREREVGCSWVAGKEERGGEGFGKRIKIKA